ncbi:hypothetical protein BD311DRAFT_108130 [Dichomitus squalens]|uniref:F-box domain-containing protein n=1 Tax=Dichomitus squalens TaxID=114155 RepID=A0A4Q9M7N5_9APHY|nr:hypothetical protein BD311DRAFT_108130 [Dichomitus squalens]
MSSIRNRTDSLRLLPLVSSTTQSPALPWEVIERAIDHCSGDKATLRAFALTCSQLHTRSLFVLFTDVDIRSEKQLTQFYDAVQAQPRLQLVVRSLSLPWSEDSPLPLLSMLPCLDHVAFNGLSPMLWVDDQLPPSTPLCGRQCLPGLRSLAIQGVRFQTRTAFLHFLLAFPNVEHLTCERLSLYADTPLGEGDLSRRLPLRTLNVSVCMIICVP